jgi:hypothetical protein
MYDRIIICAEYPSALRSNILIEELQDLRGGKKCFLLEDGDISHGHRSRNNLPHQMRLQNDIELHPHLAQSPDLMQLKGFGSYCKNAQKEVG